MRLLIVILGMFSTLAATAEETRCGWLENPSPANMWLIDRDGSWDISVQGTSNALDDKSMELLYQATADENEFVRTNRNYGFSCACLTVDVDEETNSITTIYKSKQLPLKQCLEDISITKEIPLPFK
ncbi:DUF4087 domain-containing protein [Vibrio alginolyticus]|uniref:DUF4087 domain-containing protein n=1 Tax=Vibrio harveyi group TaxID=717610 RepID=UPI0003494FC9|nr:MULTISPECIES: DUF4087 domain-containing protein [Vibrio harveyi group]EKE1121035.1 DUF4087 domain-containing protein [Vibrio vulnificus]EME0140614.1 DUF4087 domain-containing protein [Vibrio vulnificus]MBS9962036.1 DUF4087 domain-containing protein [Vibrio alginolyticus]MBT0032872.1 DUF4087 domain-containing protein [Vibrio alginolyticus]MCC8256598.1 DUF4087 domain-containing protein [Vibrio campbellii CAIM 333]